MGYIVVKGKIKLTRDLNPDGTFKSGINDFWTPKRIAKAKSLYVDQKKSLRYVADYFNLASYGSITWLAQHEGWLRKKRIGFSKAEKRKIKRWYLKKLKTAAYIAKKLKVNDSKICEFIKKEGYARTQSEVTKLAISNNTHYCSKVHKIYWNKNLEIDVNLLRYRGYRQVVRRFTNAVMYRYKNTIDENNLRGYEFHVDHQFSLMNGYWIFSNKKQKYVRRKNLVPLTVICHPANLKLLDCKTNNRKGPINHISLKQLKQKIKKYDKKFGKVF